jgi:hypothetical protein
VHELIGLGEIGLVNPLPLLIEHCLARLLKQDVVARIPDGELGLDFLFEVVVGIFGLSDSMGQVVGVQEGAVSLEGLRPLAFQGVLGDEFPVESAGARLEERLERGTNGRLVLDPQVIKLG